MEGTIHKSKIFLICLFSFIGGVGIGSFWQTDLLYLYFLLLALLVVLILGRQNKNLKLISLWGLFFVFGIARFLLSVPSDANQNHIKYFNKKDVVIRGVIAQESDIRADHQRLVIKAQDKNSRYIRGRLLVKTALYPAYQYGDEVEVSCFLRAPEPIEDFAYDKYLARYDIYSVCWRPDSMVLLNSGKGNKIFSKIFYLKNKFISSINNILPEPHSSFLAGLLVGARTGIPQYLLEDFNKIGITHIIAISGSNITIIAAVIIVFLDSLGVSRRNAFWYITIGIIFFVFLTGATASVVRAGIMGILILLAKQMGRMSRALGAIIFTAFLMLLVNPKILIFDAGFQLSFLATLGIVYIDPILQKLTVSWPEILGLKQAFITTLAAIAATAPLLAWQFGSLSIVAPLANILILPVVPPVMALGFLAGVIGLFLPFLGEILAWPGWVILEYIIRISEFLANFNFAAIEIVKFHWLFVAALYLILIFGILKFKKSLSRL